MKKFDFGEVVKQVTFRAALFVSAVLSIAGYTSSADAIELNAKKIEATSVKSEDRLVVLVPIPDKDKLVEVGRENEVEIISYGNTIVRAIHPQIGMMYPEERDIAQAILDEPDQNGEPQRFPVDYATAVEGPYRSVETEGFGNTIRDMLVNPDSRQKTPNALAIITLPNGSNFVIACTPYEYNANRSTTSHICRPVFPQHGASGTTLGKTYGTPTP